MDTRKTDSKKQLQRQWRLLSLIPQRGGTPKSTKQISDELNQLLEATSDAKVTKRTVERDLKVLKEVFSNSIDCIEEGNAQLWGWVNASNVWALGLTPEQALAFHMIRRNLDSLLPEATLQSLKSFFDSAEATLGSMSTTRRSWKDKFRLVESRQMLAPANLSAEVAREIRKALLNDKTINIEYRDRSGAIEGRKCVLPLALVQRGAELYLVYSQKGDPAFEYKFIPMQRIVSTSLSLENQAPPWHFDVDTYLSSGQLGFGRSYPIRVGAAIELEALFSHKTAQRLKETPLGEGQVIEEYDSQRMRLCTTVKFSGQLVWWLLSYGASVEVVNPPDLRALIAEELRAAAARYL